MKRLRIDKDILLCALSGVMLAMAFPRPDLASLAWIGLVPLFLVSSRRPFRSGFVAGAVFFALVLYWLNIVMTTFGRLHPVLSVTAYLLLVLYLALFFGVATWAAARMQEKVGLSPIITLPVLWVGLEFIRSFLLSGFPWASLGYSQQSHPLLYQSADLFGIYGIGFLIVLSNAVLAGVVGYLRNRSFWSLPWRGITVFALLFLLNIAYGTWRLDGDIDQRDDMIQTTLVQGNIDQSIKWSPAHKETTVDIYRRLSLDASGDETDLIIWPESATPFYFQDDGELGRKVSALPRETDSYLLFGSPAYERVDDRYKFLNSAYLLDSDGSVLGRSDKVHLVPFGEYVPLGRLLPFIDKLVVGIGDFSPGAVSPLSMNGTEVGVLVCYEAIFPELARQWVRQGSDLLVNITNDAWFGRSSAPSQHLAMTRFRAVENRIWIARAANTGISAFIAPSGKIVAQTQVFQEETLRESIGTGSRATLYTRFGDVGPVLCILLGLYWLVRTRRGGPPSSS
ncbi:MAG: apolipoprotein N-acyltransferase [Desulfuromonadales bacterium]